MCSTKSLLAGDGEIIAQIYKERVIKRGYGSGSWGWLTACHEGARRAGVDTDRDLTGPR
jgi:formate dehydrogenase iron-sulfur subunit